MDKWSEEVESAYHNWAHNLRGRRGPSEPVKRDRACTHFTQGAAGQSYGGEEFIRSLQRLRGDAAMRMARRVESFFWSDARHIRVWLCRDCAAEMRL